MYSRQPRASASRRRRLSVSSVQVSNVLSTPRIVYDQVSKQSFIVTRNATPRQHRKKKQNRARVLDRNGFPRFSKVMLFRKVHGLFGRTKVYH